MAITAPTDISGCVLWLDPGAITGLSDGEAISSWSDSSGNTNNAAQSTVADQPTYDDGTSYAHGRPGVRCTAAQNLEVVNDATLNASELTYFVVHRNTRISITGSTNNSWLFNRVMTNASTFALRYVSGKRGFFFRLEAAPGTAHQLDNNATLDGAMRRHFIRYDGANCEYYDNESLVDSVAQSGGIDTTNGGALIINGHPSVADLGTIGIYYDFVVYNRALTNTERDDLVAWAKAKYPDAFDAGTEMFVDGLKGVAITDDGTDAYLAYVKVDGVTVAYKTAPLSTPHTWTDQGNIFTSTQETRGLSLVLDSGTWYLYYDDRDNGTVRLATGASLASLVDQGVVLAGTGGVGDFDRFVRHPAVLPPSQAHDTNWHMLYDGREDFATGLIGAIGHATSTDGSTWTRDSANNPVLDKSGVEDFEKTDVGAPGLVLIDGVYHVFWAGYNDDYSQVYDADLFPHWIGYGTSTDLTSITRSGDSMSVPMIATDAGFDGAAQAQPEPYVPGDGNVYIYYTGQEWTDGTGVTLQPGYTTSNIITIAQPQEFPVSDAFTDTDGVLLQNHAASDGGTWTVHPESDAGVDFVVASNRIYSEDGTTLYYHSAIPSSAEYDVEAVFKILTAPQGATGITARTDPTAQTHYMVLYSQPQTAWRLFKVVAGVITLLDTHTEALTDGAERTVRLEIRDSAKKVYVDDVEILSSSDNEITAAGRVGVRNGGNGNTSSAGTHIGSIGATIASVVAPSVRLSRSMRHRRRVRA